jgi:hypothetical protein
MADSSRRRNPFFMLVAFLSALFVVTILALVAAVFGDPRAPAARLVDRYAGFALTVEVVGILMTGGLALAVDRRQTLAAHAQAAATAPADREQCPRAADERPASADHPA